MYTQCSVLLVLPVKQWLCYALWPQDCSSPRPSWMHIAHLEYMYHDCRATMICISLLAVWYWLSLLQESNDFAEPSKDSQEQEPDAENLPGVSQTEQVGQSKDSLTWWQWIICVLKKAQRKDRQSYICCCFFVILFIIDCSFLSLILSVGLFSYGLVSQQPSKIYWQVHFYSTYYKLIWEKFPSIPPSAPTRLKYSSHIVEHDYVW